MNEIDWKWNRIVKNPNSRKSTAEDSRNSSGFSSNRNTFAS